MLIILRLIQGLAGSTGIVLSLAVITDLFTGKTLTKQIAINQTINGVFPVLAPVFGGVIIAIANWQMTFWVLAVLGLILFVSVLIALPETLPAEKAQVADHPSVVGGFAQLFKQREFVLYALTQAFMTAALFAYISGSSFVLQKIFGMSVTTFGIVYAINGAGIALMSSLAGRWAVKFGEYRVLRWFIRAGFLGGLLLFVTALLPKSLWLILPPLFLVVTTVGGIISLTDDGVGEARATTKRRFSFSVAWTSALCVGWTDVTDCRAFRPTHIHADGNIDCCGAIGWFYHL